MKSDKLIILDLNGILMYKVRDLEKSEEKTRQMVQQGIFWHVGHLDVWVPDGLEEFVQNLMTLGSVAIWTSMVSSNAHKLLKILPRSLRDRFSFVWCRDRCDRYEFSAPLRGVWARRVQAKGVYKDLQRVWKNGTCWNASNTLIVDDSYSKVDMNPTRNTLVLTQPTWKVLWDRVVQAFKNMKS